MRISELIERLQEQLATEGDLIVECRYPDFSADRVADYAAVSRMRLLSVEGDDEPTLQLLSENELEA